MGVLSILAGLQELALRTLQELAKTTTACSNAMNALDIGKIKGTADGQSYYWTERNVLDDPYDEKAAFILDPELTLEANDICSFTFTVPVSNPYYDKLLLKKPVISVEEDGHEIFMGYITELSTNFNLDIDVTCASELGYLQGSKVLRRNRNKKPDRSSVLKFAGHG